MLFRSDLARGSSLNFSAYVQPDIENFGDLRSIAVAKFVVQLTDGGRSSLYDKQGLQFLILDRKQKGLDTSAAEKALARINSIQDSIGLHYLAP